MEFNIVEIAAHPGVTCYATSMLDNSEGWTTSNDVDYPTCEGVACMNYTAVIEGHRGDALNMAKNSIWIYFQGDDQSNIQPVDNFDK